MTGIQRQTYITDQSVSNESSQTHDECGRWNTRTMPYPGKSRPVAAVVASITLIALAGCSRPEPVPEPVRAVRTMTIGSETAGGSHEYAAELRARTESRLGFRVAGKLLSRRVDAGQRVRAGEALAQLDAADLRLGQEAALATVRAAQTQHDLAAAEFQRFRELRNQGFISGLELERREATLKAQKAQLDQALAQAGVQGNQTAYATLTAPASGVVTAVEAEPGAVLAAGTPVVRLAHDGPRDAVFAVPEDNVAALRGLLGKAGALKVRRWASTEIVPATVREVAAAADATTRTFLVKADLGMSTLQLGQTLTVSIEQPRREGVARLPLTALMQHQGQSAVWVVDRPSMTVKVQPVSVAGADGNSVIVSAGLSPGQTVVTAGVHVLTPGQKVKFFQMSAMANPPAVPPGQTASSPR